MSRLLNIALVIVLCVTHLIFYFSGVEHGKEIEREDTRKFVNSGMTKAGFCRWFTTSRIMEDCRTTKDPSHE